MAVITSICPHAMPGLLALYGRPLAPFTLTNRRAQEISTIVEDLESQSLRFPPATPLEKLWMHGELPQPLDNPKSTANSWLSGFRQNNPVLQKYLNRVAASALVDTSPVRSWLLGLHQTTHALCAYFKHTASAKAFNPNSFEASLRSGGDAQTLLSRIYLGSTPRPERDDDVLVHVLMPTIGALMCMAPNRAHFLSLISGRPIPEDEIWDVITPASAATLFAAVKGFSRDITYAGIVPSCITTAINLCHPEKTRRGLISKAIENWFIAFNRAFFEKEPGIQDAHNPLHALAGIGALGIAGPLASEKAYRQHRNAFLLHQVFLNNIDVR